MHGFGFVSVTASLLLVI